jgi:acyl-CoA synthetase (AMP-forming)/AMP-acid ligase II
VATINSRHILATTRFATDEGKGICVGRPVRGIEVAIIVIRDEPIPHWDDSLRVPTGTIGEIVVKGPVVTREYFHRPEATKLAKIAEASGDSVWHRMGDVGYLDEEGHLWFCGRKSHRVILPSETLFTIPCEAIFNTHPDVSRSALVGVEIQGVRHPVLCVERKPQARGRPFEDLTRELQTLAGTHPHAASIRLFLDHAGFPVDIRHNAKIHREKLALWAAKRMKAQSFGLS